KRPDLPQDHHMVRMGLIPFQGIHIPECGDEGKIEGPLLPPVPAEFVLEDFGDLRRKPGEPLFHVADVFFRGPLPELHENDVLQHVRPPWRWGSRSLPRRGMPASYRFFTLCQIGKKKSPRKEEGPAPEIPRPGLVGPSLVPSVFDEL